MRPVTRLQPLRPVRAYQTFQVLSPATTHFRSATCEEVDCQFYLGGWRLRVEGLSPQDLHAAKTSGRKFVQHNIAAGETWLVFEAGQPCFEVSRHRLRIDRPEIYAVRDGDWRGNPTGRRRVHQRPADWIEDFGEHQQRIADQHERG